MSQTSSPLMSAEAARGHLAMLAFSSLVAGSFALGGMAAPLIDPLALNAVRFWIAAGVMLVVLVHRGATGREHFRAPWRFVVLGGLFAIYFSTMFKGLQTATPVSIAAVFTLTPIIAAGFSWLLLRQITTPRMALALSIAAAGAVWVIFDGDLATLVAFEIGRGEAIYFVGCIAHALYIPLVRILARDTPLVILTFGTLVSGAVLLTILAFPRIVETAWADLPWIVWITLIYIAVAATAVTFLLLQFAALRLPGAKVMAYTYLVPVWVILWGLGLGQGIPATAVFSGVALVVLGLLLLLKDQGDT